MKRLCDKECWKCGLDECLDPWLSWEHWKWWRLYNKRWYDRLYNSKKNIKHRLTFTHYFDII